MHTPALPGSRSPRLSRRGFSAPSTKAFTLIELLTVIAIIGVLAGIMIPVVSKVRSAAKASACVSNLREMGRAFLLYANDNKNYLPKAVGNSADWPDTYWMYQLHPYIGRNRTLDSMGQRSLIYDGVFRCPGNEKFDLASSDWQAWGSYGMNTFNPNTAATSLAVKLNDAILIPNPTRVALVVESVDAKVQNIYVIYSPPVLRHNSKDNVLFCDGHVQAVPRNGLAWPGAAPYNGKNGLVLP